MMAYGLIEAVIVVVVGLFVLACAAVLVYGIWLLNKTMKRLDRLEMELKSMGEKLGSLKGNYPPNQ